MKPEDQNDTRISWSLLLVSLVLTMAIYWPGLSGGYLFDDYPNIVNNTDLHIESAGLSDLTRAALASPSSELKRPLASLSLAINYLVTGLDPYWMKLTNLAIHLLNGLLVFLLARSLLELSAEREKRRTDVVAAIVAAGWLMLPINLTAVLYVVQRMESLANAFVLLGLLGYATGRIRMQRTGGGHGLFLCIVSVIVATALGLLAKETAVMLPLYALLIEVFLFRFRSNPAGKRDLRVFALFLTLLILPMIVGLAWLLPSVLDPATWVTRDFTLGTRLLSEARIVVNYIGMTLLPTPDALSFYHDDFRISAGLLSPWTTLTSLLLVTGLIVSIWWLRYRQPVAALGLSLFFASHLLTGTVLPLELIFEHRNYFASFGLLLALISMLAVPRTQIFARPLYTLLAGLFLVWISHTAMLAYSWGNPLRLASELAARGPASARAQYELAYTYVVYSNYRMDSPFIPLAYTQLKHAARLPGASILPEQGLIVMNAHLHRNTDDIWWDSLTAKLRAKKPSSEDLSALSAITKCKVDDRLCDLPHNRVIHAFIAALSHPTPDARLLSAYTDYAWNVLGDHQLAMRLAVAAAAAEPTEPAYRITLIKMYAALGRTESARIELEGLQQLNTAGRLDKTLAALRLLQDHK